MKNFKVNVTPTLKRLEVISKRGISGMLAGEFRSILKGRGLEFHGYRNYNPAEDDAKHIDWKASLRSRYLVVKELVEERNNNIMFLIDVSSTMSFGSIDKLKNEYVIELFASLAHTLLGEGDSVGLAMFTDKINYFRIPNIGNKQYYIMLKSITEPSNYEGSYDLEAALHEFNARMSRQSIVILITDFIGLKGNWYDRLKLMNAKHEIIVFIIKDPRDMIMPSEVGQVYVQDPYTGEELLVDTKLVKEDYERHAHEQNQQIMKLLKDQAIDYLFLTTDKPYNKELFKFFKMRELR